MQYMHVTSVKNEKAKKGNDIWWDQRKKMGVRRVNAYRERCARVSSMPGWSRCGFSVADSAPATAAKLCA